MKKIFLGLLMFMSLQIASGQDKIITIHKDTIHCRILSVSPTHVHYEQRAESGFVVGKFIPTEQVLEYLRNAQLSEPNPNYRIEKQKTQKPKPERSWIIGLHPGRASMLASTAKDENNMVSMGIPKSQAADYIKKLKHGWSINSDIHYMFYDNFGLGAKYSLFTNSAQKDLTMAVMSYYSMIPEYVCVGMKEIQYIHYAGPSVIFRQWLDKNRKFQLTESISAGYLHFRGETRMDPNQYTFLYTNTHGTLVPIYNILSKSNTWGANLDLSANYFPKSWLSVGVNVGLMYARLKKIDIATKHITETVYLDKKDYENLTRLDYTFSIRFHF